MRLFFRMKWIDTAIEDAELGRRGIRTGSFFNQLGLDCHERAVKAQIRKEASRRAAWDKAFNRDRARSDELNGSKRALAVPRKARDLSATQELASYVLSAATFCLTAGMILAALILF